MIFKKTILTLSLCLASGLALAATTEPAPSATPTPTVEAEQNLAQSAPAYTLTWGESTGSGFMFYPGLSDGIRAHANSAADAEKWGPELGFPIQMHVVDLGGGACVDKFGTCAATAGKGTADMNTVVVYSMQDAASTQEPSDTSVFTERGAVDFTVYGYVGSEAGVSEDDALMHPERWEVIGEVKDNNLVKRTLSFPTKKYAKINVEVSKTAGQTNRNFYGYEVVDPQKEPAIVEIQAFNIPQASPAP